LKIAACKSYKNNGLDRTIQIRHPAPVSFSISIIYRYCIDEKPSFSSACCIIAISKYFLPSTGNNAFWGHRWGHDNPCKISMPLQPQTIPLSQQQEKCNGDY